MSLIYHFKKEKLESGAFVSRPRILVEISGSNGAIVVPALIDSGCDATVIPEGIAKAIGLSLDGEKDKLYAFREMNEVVRSRAAISFLGKEHRQSIKLPNVPVLVVVPKKGDKEEEDITIGIEGVFDAFDITFKKSQNKIILQKSVKHLFLTRN